MAAIIGVHTMLDKALPTGWDSARILQWQLRSGRTFQETVTQLAQASAAWNQAMAAKWGRWFWITDEISFEYRDGSSLVPARKIADDSRNAASSERTIGHMIDLAVYQEAIGGSKRAFKRLRDVQINASLQHILQTFEWRFEIELLSRLMLPTEFSVGSGDNVGWVNGASGNVDYVPPPHDGEAWTSSHDHYVGVDSGSNDHGDLLNTLVETVSEHGFEAPYLALVSKADLASYMALGDQQWVKVVDPVVQMIDTGATSAGSSFLTPGQRPSGFAGYFQSDYGLVECWYSQRLDTGYAGLIKSSGNNVGTNPLAVRVDPDEGFGVRLVPETTDDNQYPIKQVDVEMEFGVGLNGNLANCRVAGAAGRLVAGGAWADPTID